MSVNALGIQHVLVTVEPEHVEAARTFYVELLGLKPTRDAFDRPGFWLAAGVQELHVRVEQGIQRDRTKAHPAIVVDDLEACRQAVEQAGYKAIPQPKMEGFERFHTLDPSGNRVEIMQRV